MRWFARCFSAFFLAVTFWAIGTTIEPSVSSAEDVWVYSRGGYEYYLSTKSIKVRNEHPTYTCNVKVVYNGQYHDFQVLGFASENDIIVGYSFGRSDGKWEYHDKVSKDPYFSAVWNAMKPYLR